MIFPGHITVRADLPGMPAENIEVTVTPRYIEISGWPAESPGVPNYHTRERPCGIVRRTLHLPDEVVARMSVARLSCGVLEIRVPRTPLSSGWNGQDV